MNSSNGFDDEPSVLALRPLKNFLSLPSESPCPDYGSTISSLFQTFVDSDDLIDEDACEGFCTNLMVFVFYLRDCRGGCGMRDPFYSCILACAAYVPRLVLGCLRLIPQYGYFKDYFRLLSESPSVTMNPDALQEVRDTIINIVVQQLRTDESLLRAGYTTGTQSPCSVAAATDDSASKAASPVISLCAKYCPREGKGFARENKDQLGLLVRRLFPGDPAAKQKYRQLLSRLCAALDVAEQKICSHRLAELNVESLPRACYRTCEPMLLSRGLLPLSTAESKTATLPLTLPLTLQRVVQRLLEVKQQQQAARRRFNQRQQHQRWRGNRSAGRGRGQEATRSHDANEVQLPSLVALREKYEARAQTAVPRDAQRSAYSEAALV